MNTPATHSAPSTDEPSESALEEAAEWIVRLNDAAVTEQDFIAWQSWVAEHPGHARAFHDVQDTWNRSASVMQARTEDLTRLRAGLGDPVPSARTSRIRSVRWVALAAALLVATVGLTSWWRASSNTVQTTTGELRSVRLPDGSRVALGPETQLSLDFSEHGRRVTMNSGEAYFEVVHAPERPFTVVTRTRRIVAVGTAFAVNAGDERVEVSVTRGVVRVEATGTPATDPAVTVEAGQRLVRDHAQTRLEQLTSPADALAWQSGRLEYQGEPLRAVVADINRYSVVKVQIATPALAEQRYTGTVFPDSLDAWLASLDGVFAVPVQVEQQGDHTRIIRVKPSDSNIH